MLTTAMRHRADAGAPPRRRAAVHRRVDARNLERICPCPGGGGTLARCLDCRGLWTRKARARISAGESQVHWQAVQCRHGACPPPRDLVGGTETSTVESSGMRVDHHVEAQVTSAPIPTLCREVQQVPDVWQFAARSPQRPDQPFISRLRRT